MMDLACTILTKITPADCAVTRLSGKLNRIVSESKVQKQNSIQKIRKTKEHNERQI